MEHDLSRLEKQLHALDDCVAELNSIGLPKQLLAVIHQPGWTTLPELFLVTTAVESLTRQIQGHVQAFNQLLEGSKMIERAGVRAA